VYENPTDVMGVGEIWPERELPRPIPLQDSDFEYYVLCIVRPTGVAPLIKYDEMLGSQSAADDRVARLTREYGDWDGFEVWVGKRPDIPFKTIFHRQKITQTGTQRIPERDATHPSSPEIGWTEETRKAFRDVSSDSKDN